MPTGTMEVETSEIERSVDIVLDDGDIVEAVVLPAQPRTPPLARMRPQTLAPKRTLASVLLTVTTVLALTLFGFALALAIVLLFR